MTRRTAQAAAAAAAAARATPASSSTPVRALSAVPTPLLSDVPFAAEYAALRRNWKWANFSQFFYTFNQLLNMPDVSLIDIEDDLARSSAIVLPRVMHRLLVVLTQDRKLALANWQNSLRKQYARRDPDKNPIGPPPAKATRSPSPEPLDDDDAADTTSHAGPSSEGADATAPLDHYATMADATAASESAPEPSVPSSPPVGPSNDEPTADVAPEEESKDWMTLPMLEKLGSLHLLTEWQFQNVTRLRQTMRDDDENASWRIEPIGYDAKANAYWVIGPDRLWIQRVPAKSPRSLKRKRPTSKPKKRAPSPPPDDDFDAHEPEPASKRMRTTRSEQDPPLTPGRSSRAAKLQANKKLDAQAKELAELKRQAALEQRRAAKAPHKPVNGIRVSRRLRSGGADRDSDAEWQEIPEEWLREGQAEAITEKEEERAESEAESALTELSDSELDLKREPEAEKKPVPAANGRTKSKGKTRAKAKEVSHELEPEVAEPEWQPPDDFVEWETLCVSLHDWEHIADRFEKAAHYAEKALYKVLTQVYVPGITAELHELERKRRVEEAVTQRKRSSRLARKDAEKEEQRLAEIQRQEEEEKMGRTRRAEARLRREEEERAKRENAREQRRREREEREARRHAVVEAQEQEESSRANTPVDVVNEDPPPAQLATTPMKTSRKRQTAAAKAATTNSEGGPPKSSPKRNSRGKARNDGTSKKNEEWELDCEVCRRHGKNLDDETGLVSCGRCGKWQHIRCYDAADKRAGHPRRDWDKEEFMCGQCRTYVPVPMSLPSSSAHPYAGTNAVGVQAYGSSAQTFGSSVPYSAASRYSQYQLSTDRAHSATLQHGSVYSNGNANGAQNGMQGRYYAAPSVPSGWPGSSAAQSSFMSPTNATPAPPLHSISTHNMPLSAVPPPSLPPFAAAIPSSHASLHPGATSAHPSITAHPLRDHSPHTAHISHFAPSVSSSPNPNLNGYSSVPYHAPTGQLYPQRYSYAQGSHSG